MKKRKKMIQTALAINETKHKLLVDAIKEGIDSGIAIDFDSAQHLKMLKSKRNETALLK